MARIIPDPQALREEGFICQTTSRDVITTTGTLTSHDFRCVRSDAYSTVDAWGSTSEGFSFMTGRHVSSVTTVSEQWTGKASIAGHLWRIAVSQPVYSGGEIGKLDGGDKIVILGSAERDIEGFSPVTYEVSERDSGQTLNVQSRTNFIDETVYGSTVLVGLDAQEILAAVRAAYEGAYQASGK